MKKLSFEAKPYTVPSDDAPAETLISVYWWDVSRNPLLLANLRRPDGSLYLPKGERGMATYSDHYMTSNQPESERAS